MNPSRHASLVKRILQRPRRLIFLFLLLLLAGIGIVIFRPPPAVIPLRAAVQFLPADSRIPAQPVSLFERYVPMRWSWLWRLRDRIRGPLPAILVDARIFDCSKVTDKAVAALLPERPLGETNGLRGWILDGPALTRVKTKLESQGAQVLMHPRVQTSHAIQSSMSVGTTVPSPAGPLQAGLSLDLLPLIHPNGTELMTVFKVTEAVTNHSGKAMATPGMARSIVTPPTSLTVPHGAESSAETNQTRTISVITNLATAVRWKLPPGTGFFLFTSGQSNTTQRIGVILTVNAHANLGGRYQ